MYNFIKSPLCNIRTINLVKEIPTDWLEIPDSDDMVSTESYKNLYFISPKIN